MSDNEFNHQAEAPEEFLVSEKVFNQTADNFGYVTNGSNSGVRYGSITFFQFVTKWKNSGETEQETYVTANIRMQEEQMVELAHHIISQYEQAKKNRTVE